MARSPLSALSAFAVPLHLNILGWGLVAAAIYTFSPDVFESQVVVLGAALFAFLYTVVALVLLLIRVRAPEAAEGVPGASWSAVAMALLGAALLLAVTYQTAGSLGGIVALASLVVGLLVGSLSVASLKRHMGP
ncbi:MAG: hypothetical protein AAFQ43_13335 [Bacteroidota bacterium]